MRERDSEILKKTIRGREEEMQKRRIGQGSRR